MSEKQLIRKLRKITAVMIGIGVILLVGSGLLNASLGRVQKRTMTSQMMSEAEEYQAGVLRKVNSDLQTLQTLASFFKFSNTIDKIDAEAFAKGLYESNNHNSFIRMGYFTRNGEGIRVTANQNIERDLRVENLETYFQEVIEQAWQGESGVSKMYYDDSMKKQVLGYAVPVYDGDEIVGALCATDGVSAFQEILDDKTTMNGHGHIHMIGKEGKFLIRTGENLVDKKVSNIFEGDYITEKEQKKIKTAMDADKGVFSEFVYDGTTYKIYLEPVGMNGWYLFCVDTMHGLNAPVYQMLQVTRVVFITLLVMNSFLIFYVYTMLRKNNKHLIRLAYYDPLTGAYNAARFIQEMTTVTQESGEYSVGVLNIHQFKFINEIFGRAQADMLLCYIRQVLERNIRPGEYFCRDTGDFFWIMLLDQDEEVIKKRIYMMMKEISAFSLGQHHNYQIRLYCGVAVRRDDSSAEMMMTHAMFALQTAKGSDRNNVWVYDVELHEQEILQNYIESHMYQALRNKEFRMFLQPKFDVRTGRIGGAEALVRWFTEEGKMIYPNQFIPLFESNGFCARLDMYMVEQVCRQIRKWTDDGIEPIPISVNQSKLLFYEEDYIENLCGILEKYHIKSELITLEILEGLAVGNMEELNRKIDLLKEKGFRISMDDFGSGYSSFNTLGRIHIDELKMDRVFLSAITGEEGKRQEIIMTQVVDLAKRLQISTVAEGVETEQNEALIRRLGCDYGQGFYYSRPVSRVEFDEKYMKIKRGSAANE